MDPSQFAYLLTSWSLSHPRTLPWKNTSDPYIIWVSEIILQQTRVSQGTPYFLRFIDTFPDVKSLASAHEEEVLKVWEGLGYYSRARNMHHAAKTILEKHSGIFPSRYEDILALKGIGPYTAAAISSFAFGLRYAVIDGNVQRVISRLEGIEGAPGTKDFDAGVSAYVDLAIVATDPALFNQAIMDLGATVCTPLSPSCSICPVNDGCYAQIHNKTGDIPARKARPQKKIRYFHYFQIVLPRQTTVITRRSAEDIWKGLYELPMLETPNPEPPSETITDKLWADIFETSKPKEDYVPVFRIDHILTHQIIRASFYKIDMQQVKSKIKNGYYLVESKKVGNFAFPKIFKDYFDLQNIGINGIK